MRIKRIGLEILDEAVYQYQKKTVRKMILVDHKRPDGRAIDTDHVRLQQRLTLYREFMVQQCLHVDRHRSVLSQRLHRFLSARVLTD